VVAGSVGTTVGAGAYGLAYERHQTQVIRTTLPVSNLPPALDGLRIGLITDLHRSHTVPQQDVEHAARLMMREQPELIVLGGDYVTLGQLSFAEPCADALAELRAPLGVYAALGNHDDEREVPAALNAKGFTVLRDARTTITARGERLDIAGIRFWTRRGRDIARVLQGARGPVVLIAHDPRRLTEAADLGVGVVLSGHTHGGQVVLPLLGPLAARRFPIIAGSGRRRDTSIFVSRGVGTVYVPYRLNCPPDIAIITLIPH
jgi:predicted MPP superfamily phosphohydrolase